MTLVPSGFSRVVVFPEELFHIRIESDLTVSQLDAS
jgi:hypothetical protein